MPNDELKRNVMNDMAVTWILSRLSVGSSNPSTMESNASAAVHVGTGTGADFLLECEPPRKVAPAPAPTTTAAAAAAAAGLLPPANNAVADSGGNFIVFLCPATGDALLKEQPNKNQQAPKLDVICERPETIHEIEIVRVRKTTTQDFQAALIKLKSDHDKLNEACFKASRIAGLAQSSVSGFQSMFQDSRATFDPETMSIARQRWIKATRRVILQNAVKRTHRRLARYTMG